MNNILSFRGKYYFLSNFYDVAVIYDGIWYGNAEAAFQAQKCMKKEEKERFSYLPASEAKRLGRKVYMRQDWNKVKVGIMKNILRAKFDQNPDIQYELMETGNAMLVEGNTWGDTFWGVDMITGKGQNMLGELLMQIRAEYQEDK